MNYTYDSSGRLQTVSDGTDTFTYGYETNSYLLATLTALQHTVGYTYEPNCNVMTNVDNKLTGGTTSVSSYTYTYDALGRRADREQSGSAFTQTNKYTFTYNTRSEVIASTNDVQLAAEYTPSYSYDKIGNRKTSTGIESVTYTANTLNQYADIQVSSLSSQPFYDLDGNLTGDGGNWTYNWNNENRLASATDGSRTINFTYDYQGRLVKKDDGTEVKIYVYDGWNRIATFDSQVSTLSLQVSYLWGLDLSGSFQGAGGIGGLLKEGSLYPTYDANGNIMQKLDGNGVTVMNVAYDPFGNIISGTLVGEYGFSTKPLIGNLDWYYYGFRYYDPVTGRWPSRDPIGEIVGVNIYHFNWNDGINNWDFLGLRTFTTPWVTTSDNTVNVSDTTVGFQDQQDIVSVRTLAGGTRSVCDCPDPTDMLYSVNEVTLSVDIVVSVGVKLDVRTRIMHRFVTTIVNQGFGRIHIHTDFQTKTHQDFNYTIDTSNALSVTTTETSTYVGEACESPTTAANINYQANLILQQGRQVVQQLESQAQQSINSIAQQFQDYSIEL